MIYRDGAEALIGSGIVLPQNFPVKDKTIIQIITTTNPFAYASYTIENDCTEAGQFRHLSWFSKTMKQGQKKTGFFFHFAQNQYS